MRKNKLISYFETLSKKELTQFHKFSKGVFTNNSQYTKLFNYLVLHRDSLRRRSFDFNKLHENICPDLSRKSFQNFLLESAKFLEEFFIWKEFQKKKDLKRIHLLSALQNRGLFSEFDKLAKQQRSKIKTGKIELKKHLYLLYIDHLQYFSDNPAKTTIGEKILESLIENFTTFIHHSALFYKAEVINRNSSKNEVWDHKITELENLSINLSSNLSKLLNLILHTQSSNEESFFKLREILLNETSSINEEFQIIIQIHLHKYLDKNIPDTKVRGVEKLKLYSFALDNGHLNLNKKLPLIRFHNIIDTACRLQEFEWVEEFITASSKQVSSPNIDDTISLAKAQVVFANKNREIACDGVIDILRNISFSNFRQELRAKTMLTCSYYESKELRKNRELLITYLNTYKKFLVRRKKDLNLDEYIGLKNLIDLIKLLSRKKPPLPSVLLEKVNNSNVFYKSWAIARIKELQSLE